MLLKDLMVKKGISAYRLSREAGVPYATVCGLADGRTKIEKCNAGTLYKIAKYFHIPMEIFLEPVMEERVSFDIFKSNVCHSLRYSGDRKFLYDQISGNSIRKYYNRGWYPEAFYLLALADYLCRVNHISPCVSYDDLRGRKLSEPLYPSSILAMDAIAPELHVKERAIKEAIPEFLRHNIVEAEVRDVV